MSSNDAYLIVNAMKLKKKLHADVIENRGSFFVLTKHIEEAKEFAASYHIMKPDVRDRP